MIALLLILETLLAPFVGLGIVVVFAISRRRGLLAGLVAELPERLGGLSAEGRAKLAGRRVWWFHAASAGEVGGLAPLLEAHAARPDAPAIFLTTMTAAGREAARRLPSVAWAQLAPADAWPCVSRLLGALRAERLVLAETELWPTLILLAARSGLRPALVNGRLTGRTTVLRPLAPLFAPVLARLEAVGAQSESEAERFRALGAPPERVRVTGNCKYDRDEVPSAAAETDARLRRLGWEDAPLFVAGSTHPVEEDAVLAGYLQAKSLRPELRLILAPRHPERAAEAWRALMDASLRAQLWSRLGPGSTAPEGAEALLVDAMGPLPSLFARARVAFVGGTLVAVGGHNLLEPALAAVPVLFGPHTGHIAAPADLLEAGGGGFRVRDAAQIAERLVELLADAGRARAAGAKARRAARSLRGATARTSALLEMIK